MTYADLWDRVKTTTLIVVLVWSFAFAVTANYNKRRVITEHKTEQVEETVSYEDSIYSKRIKDVTLPRTPSYNKQRNKKLYHVH